MQITVETLMKHLETYDLMYICDDNMTVHFTDIVHEDGVLELKDNIQKFQHAICADLSINYENSLIFFTDEINNIKIGVRSDNIDSYIIEMPNRKVTIYGIKRKK